MRCGKGSSLAAQDLPTVGAGHAVTIDKLLQTLGEHSMPDVAPAAIGSIHEDGSSEVTVNGVTETVTGPGTSLVDARAAVTDHVARRAATTAPVVMEVTDPEVTVQLMVHPGGSVSYLYLAVADATDASDATGASDGPGTHDDSFGRPGSGGDDLPEETQARPLVDPATGAPLRRRDYAAAVEQTAGKPAEKRVQDPPEKPVDQTTEIPLGVATPLAPAAFSFLPPSERPTHDDAPAPPELVAHSPFVMPAPVEAPPPPALAPVAFTAPQPPTYPQPPARPQEPQPQPQAPAPAPAPQDEPAAPAATTEQPTSRREARASFLQSTEREAPASIGWRGVLRRLGISITPSEAERARRTDESAVAQHWPGTRTIAVVNGKGGAGKTPTTAMLAAVLARQGGGGVLAWDNNETRGTLGWRTEQGPHESSVRDLLPRTDDLLAPSARAAEVAYYVHHQTRDMYDVLRSTPHLLSAQQRLSGDDFDAVHDVASKYFRMLLIDSGNDEAAEHWLRMIDHAHQIVVPLRAEDEHAEAAALLLEELATRDEHSAQLASRAVVVVSEARTDAAAKAQTIATGFGPLVRSAVVIPYDPSMVGGLLRFDSLRPATQRAWLHAAAEVARGL